MNALVKKEIRLLLPTFLIALFAAAVMMFIPDIRDGAGREILIAALYLLPFLVCPLMTVMMALQTFGAEISLGTFSGLLAQPVERARLWRIKTGLLATALVVLGLFWCLIFWLNSLVNADKEVISTMLTTVWSFLLSVFSGALWSVLLLRQVAAALWFTILTPLALWVFSGFIFSLCFPGLEMSLTGQLACLSTVLGSYSLAGFMVSRRLFLRTQDLQLTGGEIVMPEMRSRTGLFKHSGSLRCWQPRAALWRKEFWLHQSQFVMAGVLFIAHLGVKLAGCFGSFSKNSTMEFIVSSFWLLWLVMPVLIGCAAVAEERKLGTLEGQLCLPVRRRRQFFIKLSVAIGLGILLGVIMPLLIEGARVLPDLKVAAPSQNRSVLVPVAGLTGSYVLGLTLQNLFNSLIWLLPLLAVALVCGLVTLAALYASSLSRNTLQALAPTVLLIVLAWFWLSATSMTRSYGVGWQGPLVFWMVPLAIVLAIFWQLWRNFQQPRVAGATLVRSVSVLALVFVIASGMASATYNRVWELVLPLESKPGPARFSLANPPRLESRANGVIIYLPDGRVWLNQFGSSAPNQAKGLFLPGTNWLAVADAFSEIVGIQRDGSLWASAKPLQGNSRKSDAATMAQLADMVRVGDGSDWKALTFELWPPMLIKDDGTLWQWQWPGNWFNKKPWLGLKSIEPKQVKEAGFAWNRFEPAGLNTLLIKTNGEVWSRFGSNRFLGVEGEQKIGIARFHEINRKLFLETVPIRQFVRGSFSSWEPDWLGVAYDGTFRALGVWGRLTNSANVTGRFASSNRKYIWGTTSQQMQIGKQTNWIACAKASGWPVTLRSDGTLWRWKMAGRLAWQNMSDANSEQIGERSDWIAVATYETGDYRDDGFVALAADGSLWQWRFEPNTWGGHVDDRGRQLLRTSRKPQLLGNIFAAGQ